MITHQLATWVSSHALITLILFGMAMLIVDYSADTTA
jgi:hypothetical protein